MDLNGIKSENVDNSEFIQVLKMQNAGSDDAILVGFLRGGVQGGGGGNWGTLRIPREDWGTLGKIREPLNNPIKFTGEAEPGS